MPWGTGGAPNTMLTDEAPPTPEPEVPSASRQQLIQRLRELEQEPRITKTAIKAAIFADRSIDWRALRGEEGARVRPLPPGWKASLVSRLLTRSFTHGGARRRPAGPDPSAPHDAGPPPAPIPSPGDVVAALCRVLDLLPPDARREVQRHLLARRDDGAAPLPPRRQPPARPPATRRLSHLLGRRHILRWRGLHCLTARLVPELVRRSAGSSTEADDETVVRQACAAVRHWWETEAQGLSHFRLRPGSRLTAQEPLVYTNLPPDHPVHAHVSGWCQAGGGASGGQDGETAVPTAPRRPGDLWRLFKRRSPVLALYRPIWSEANAARALGGTPDERPADPGPTPAAPAPPGSGGPTADDDAVLRMAAHLHPDEPWDRWADRGAFPAPAATQLHEAASLLQGFGDRAPHVMEAVRLGQRALAAGDGA